MNSSLTDDIRNAIMCGICLNVMTKPLSLPCTHSFCEDCASKVIIETSKCPFCSYGTQHGQKLTLTSSTQLTQAISIFDRILHLVDPTSAPALAPSTPPALQALPSFAVGDVVEVAPRSWPGGTGWITVVHDDHLHFDVRYVVSNSVDARIPIAFITRASEILEASRSERRRRSRMSNENAAVELHRSTSLSEINPSNIKLLPTSLLERHHAKLNQFATQFGASITNTFTSDVTHVVVTTDEHGVLHQRTMKYILGLISGKWIVSMEWIQESLKQQHVVHESNYEVVRDYKAKNANAPQRSRTATQGLFSDVSYILHGYFPSPGPPKGDILQVLSIGGAPEPLTLADNIQTIYRCMDTGIRLVNRMKKSVRHGCVVIVSNQEAAKEYISELYDGVAALRKDMCSRDAFLDYVYSVFYLVLPIWVLDCVSNFSLVDADDDIYFAGDDS